MQNDYPDPFSGIRSIAGAKKRYHTLARKYHPDINTSDTAAAQMAHINACYAACIDRLSTSRPKVRTRTADNNESQKQTAAAHESSETSQDDLSDGRHEEEGSSDELVEPEQKPRKSMARRFVESIDEEDLGRIVHGARDVFIEVSRVGINTAARKIMEKLTGKR